MTLKKNHNVFQAQKTGQAPPEMNGLSLNDSNQKPMSLFQCQLKLFKEYVVNWNPDQVEYLVMRLKDLDMNFYNKYEEYLEYGDDIHKKPKGITKNFYLHSSEIGG